MAASTEWTGSDVNRSVSGSGLGTLGLCSNAEIAETVHMRANLSPGAERMLFGVFRYRDLVTVFAGGFAAVAAERVFLAASRDLMTVTAAYEPTTAPPNMLLVFLIASALFALIIAIGRAKPSGATESPNEMLPDAKRRAKRLAESSYVRP